MAFTRANLVANTREMMDATGSARWSDTFIQTVLGVVFADEWSGILATNPYYRFGSRTVTTDANGQFLYTLLNSGAGDTVQNWYRILAITDGNTVYRQSTFRDIPVATTTNYDTGYSKLWYDAGSNLQILPVASGLSLTVTVNWVPSRVDQLSADSAAVDFPADHEVILWLEAAAMLLSKGGAESGAATVMRAMAAKERAQMYADLTRRGARPLYFTYPDTASEWGGMGMG